MDGSEEDRKHRAGGTARGIAMARENIDTEPVPDDLEGVRQYLARLRADLDSHNHDGANSRRFLTMKAETLSSRTIAMRKTAYTDTAAGLWIGLVNSIVKMNLGSASSYLKWDGTNLSLAGALTASSIDIPDASTANSFHVESDGDTYWGATTLANSTASVSKAGDAVFNSLERRDYHWFTVFESIDGYAKGGTPVLNQDSVTIPTTNVISNEAELQKIASYSNSFTWDKRRKAKFGVVFDTNTSQYMDIVSGGVTYGSNVRHIGFRVLNGALSALSDNGSGEEVTSIVASIAIGTIYELEVRHIPGVSETFYLNGALVATHTASVPSGTTEANKLLDILVRTQAAAIKSMKITFYDFWQAN